jgi:hypothetical protein
MHRVPLYAACTLTLAGCVGTLQERVKGWIKDSHDAGRSILIFVVNTQTLDYSETAGYQMKVTVGFANTGSQDIIGMSLSMDAYLLGKPVMAGSAPLRESFTFNSVIPAGAIQGLAAEAGQWNAANPSMDCARITEMDLSFADGSNLRLSGDSLDNYLASSVNKKCIHNYMAPMIRLPSFPEQNAQPVPQPMPRIHPG